MTKYFKNLEAFFPQAESVFESIHEKLPPGNYVIRRGPTGFFFAKYEKDFKIEGKVYGDARKKASRIIQTFLDRNNSTGVLLSGEKGSGKTMLGKLICQLLAEQHDVPTIFITEPWSGDAFLELIGNIDQPAVIFFDEFEKVYDGKTDEAHGNHTQAAILTLLDGIFTTQKLFILTCNDRFAIDTHMINRPGRLYYSFNFRGLNEAFIREYCTDFRLSEEAVEGICKVAALFREFNFDMLKALVEEVLRYGEKPIECLDYLNINPEYDFAEYTAQLYPAGSKDPLKKITPEKVKSPLSQPAVKFYTYEIKKKASQGSAASLHSMPVDLDDECADEAAYTEFHFVQKDISFVTKDRFELINPEGDRLVLLKDDRAFDWRAL